MKYFTICISITILNNDGLWVFIQEEKLGQNQGRTDGDHIQHTSSKTLITLCKVAPLADFSFYMEPPSRKN